MTDPTFAKYAAYYDALYRDKDYASETSYIFELLKKFGVAGGQLLEIGSGTGGHAWHLSNAGHTLHGIDLSPRMILMANLKKEKWTKEIADRVTFEIADARTFRSTKGFDLALSLFHVMSYQNRNEDVMSVFDTAFEVLKPGGLFIFDYWNSAGVLTDPPVTRVKRIETAEGQVTRIAEPSIDPVKNLVRVDYELTFESKGEREVLRESHLMRYFSQPEIELYSVGRFELLGHFGWMKSLCPSCADWNAVTVLKKVESL